ncbi:MAG: GDP-mannose 4,6-dehydratase, partial [Micavibrio aeruginosavorus]
EMFGSASADAQNEETPFHPRSPYGISKLHAHWTTINFRESYGIFAANGILFNHESPLRGKEFVTRKITDGVARIKLGGTAPIELGNLEARRDWGYAKEYVDGMWRILQASKPDTYVLATGSSYSVRDFARMAFHIAGIDIAFEGSGKDEIAYNIKNGAVVVHINPKFYRPAEIDVLTGCSNKAKRDLGWSPQTTLEDLCALMVEADIRRNLSGKSF